MSGEGVGRAQIWVDCYREQIVIRSRAGYRQIQLEGQTGLHIAEHQRRRQGAYELIGPAGFREYFHQFR